MRFFGTKEIKEHVVRVLDESRELLKGGRAIDFPAGNGVTSKRMRDLGANVTAVDLFPELFREADIPVVRGDLSLKFPMETSSLDYAVCQEGIEHVGNQEHVLSEFARVLKPGGRLLLTTPNYSNLKSKMSYLLCESEAFGRIMPPNEHETIWLSPKTQSQEPPRIYFGHCFLTGFFRLRLFSKLASLKLVRIHDSRVNSTSLMLFPLLYPFIVLSAFKTSRRFKRKSGQRELAGELFRWMVSPKLLLENHLILEFEKDPRTFAAPALANAPHSDLASFTT